MPLTDKLRAMAVAYGANSAEWLVAAGYTEESADQVSESAAPIYACGGAQDGESEEVTLYLLEINHRTRKARLRRHRPDG